MKKIQLKKSIDFDSPLSANLDLAITAKNLKNSTNKFSNFSNLTNLVKKPEIRPSTVQKPRSKSNDLKVEKLYSGKIEDYAIGQTLGFGAYAVVKLVTHVKTQEKFALKTYEKIKLLEPQRKKNLISEIKVLKSLSHPNIINIKEAIECTKQIHIVMEYAGGSSLWSYLKNRTNRALPEPTAKKYFFQIVSAMNYCHSQGVVHRDLKLENILLDSSDSVKIIDFGFATFLRSNDSSRLFCGTPSYMAPEIVGKRETPGPPADVWALGVLLFALLTGGYPFRSSTDRELYKLILKGKFEIPIGLSLAAKGLIKKILQNDPRRRPTCGQILKDAWMCERVRECNFSDISYEGKGSSRVITVDTEEKENARGYKY